MRPHIRVALFLLAALLFIGGIVSFRPTLLEQPRHTATQPAADAKAGPAGQAAARSGEMGPIGSQPPAPVRFPPQGTVPADLLNTYTPALSAPPMPGLDALPPGERASRPDAPIVVQVEGAAPRTPLPKEPRLVQPQGEVLQVTVKFRDAYFARAAGNGRLIVTSERDESALAALISEWQLVFSPALRTPEHELADLQRRAIERTRVAQPDLSGMLIARSLTATAPEDIMRLAAALHALPQVEFVTVRALDVPPPPAAYDIAPTSDLLTSAQTYRGSSGVNADWAWSEHGAKGQGVTLRHIEYAYNRTHEDLDGLIQLQPNLVSLFSGYGTDHGTAAVGILTAGDNAYGMSGLAPQATTIFYGDMGTAN